jgi:hypothetical protein
MKKQIFITIGLFFSFLTAFSQSFSGPTTVATGTTITLTGVSETAQYYGASGYEFYNVNTNIYSTETTSSTTSNPAIIAYVGITIQSVTNLHVNSGQPTTVSVKLTNSYTAPITVTFYVHADYLTGTVSHTNQLIPYTVTVNAANTSGGGGHGGSTPVGQAPDGTDGGTLTNYFWRLVQVSNNRHFYTRDRAEMQSLLGQTDASTPNFYLYNYEGAVGYVFKTQQTGTVPLWRLVKNSNGEHFWSADSPEVNYLNSHGWTFEGVTAYAYSSAGTDRIPVYRYLATGGSAGHFWTTDYNELGAGTSGWTYEGIAFYVSSVPQ